MTIFRPQSRTHRMMRNVSGYDRWLTFATIGLLAFGSILVWAATKNWFASQHLDPQYYLKRHFINILIGGAMAYATTLIDYRLLRAYTPIVWILGVLGLMAVLTPGVGSTVNGAKAWIALPGGFQIQPAELAKISIILGIAMILAERNGIGADPTDKDVMKALGVASIPIALIMLQPDLGTTLIIRVPFPQAPRLSQTVTQTLSIPLKFGFGVYVMQTEFPTIDAEATPFAKHDAVPTE